MFKRNIFLFSALLCFAGSVNAQAKKDRPNIIIIMADDLGYSDLGSFGGEIHTPNLDRLANNGLRMTNFHNNARCCPSRASLLTGQYAHKVGLAYNGNALTRNAATIAEVLQENGYQTGMSGKWHLSDDVQQPGKENQLKWLNHQGYEDKDFASRESYPINRGFQKHYGVIWGVVDYFDPFSLVNGTEPIKDVPKDFYLTDAISDTAVAYIKEFTARQQPYFLYVAHTAPHWPVQAKEEDIAKYQHTYDIGWDEIRRQRYERMVELGLIDPKTTPMLEVMGRFGRWDQLSKEQQEKQARKMATHAAMVDRLDQGVGRLIKTLEETNTLNNTIILFLADNGASPEIVQQPGYDRPSETRDGRTLYYDEKVPTELIGTQLSYTMIGPNWANAINTPYRFWKKESFEGGINTPAIIHWPAGLKAKKGSTSDALTHVIDVMPTFLELAGVSYPASYHGNNLTAMDGQSIVPVIRKKKQPARDGVFFEHENGKAFIKGNWKLVMESSKGKQWELYDLSKDRNEHINLAAQQPEKLQEMIKAWEAWYASMKPYIRPRPGSGPQ
ncbi:MAG: arylsulfatase [Candidatus Pseudobacter hemicellulosilyticus]|uniref:Arylsulfatase n=1 Tax=Candidatus Pseudobacter hemicellulosilyticus TaxID=3121375 RepID=A0AAJ5WU56_9BACT|nr:MAG: arylsulfatase [Pseudobacter sp.]